MGSGKMSGMVIIWLALVGAVGVAAAIGGRLYWQRRRLAQVKVAAETLGFTYKGPCKGQRRGQSWERLPAAIEQFDLLSKGCDREWQHLIERQQGPVKVFVADYIYSTGTQKRRKRHCQTVALIQSERLNLPRFSLVPEKLFHKVGKGFSYQDINFDSYPEFSSKYLLRGIDEESVEACFHEGVLTFFQRQPLLSPEGMSAEGAGPHLLYYSDDFRLPPNKWYQLIDFALEAYEQFSRCQLA